MKRFFTLYVGLMVISWGAAGLPAWSGTGGPDRYGYRYIDSSAPDGPDYTWYSDHTYYDREYLGDNWVSDAVNIGFSFEFYGQTYDHVYISSNGFITFEYIASSGCCHGDSIPTDSSLYAVPLVAMLWDDLNPGG